MLQFWFVCQQVTRTGAALVPLPLSYPLFALSENCAYLINKYIVL